MVVVDTISLQWMKSQLYHASSGIEPSSGRKTILGNCGSKRSLRYQRESPPLDTPPFHSDLPPGRTWMVFLGSHFAEGR
ncbi:hypothetical protein AYX14_05931 [Cryptococcus neoformans]|nr:hypothetical protein AYX15_05893 [Cryptococcus neoformans var. grubii]OWZ66605.1 hypothetical protein AYX14_05931 [Cryptococcus neoformans var. grubii]